MQNFKISYIAVIFLFNLEIYYDAIKILIEIQKLNQRHRTPHDFTSHTTNENLWYNRNAGEVEGRFVDLITPLEHDRIIFEHTELLIYSVR